MEHRISELEDQLKKITEKYKRYAEYAKKHIQTCPTAKVATKG